MHLSEYFSLAIKNQPFSYIWNWKKRTIKINYTMQTMSYDIVENVF